MGTRASVKFFSEFDQKVAVANVYHQFDGYISGVGHELAEFLKSKTLINGISDQTMEGGYANGMNCLAAQYVANQKTRIGGVYLFPADNNQEYNYNVHSNKGSSTIITVLDSDGTKIFSGTPQQLLDFEE